MILHFDNKILYTTVGGFLMTDEVILPRHCGMPMNNYDLDTNENVMFIVLSEEYKNICFILLYLNV